jgi:hypothetical protein
VYSIIFFSIDDRCGNKREFTFISRNDILFYVARALVMIDLNIEWGLSSAGRASPMHAEQEVSGSIPLGSILFFGVVSKRLKGLAWKVSRSGNRREGSNPSNSVSIIY